MQNVSNFHKKVSTTKLLVNYESKYKTDEKLKFETDGKSEGMESSDEEQDNNNSGGEAELPEIDPRAEDRELKNHLLKKYSGYLSSLKQELSKKKKKGKLPKEARQKLLTWWELHYKWPYPSVRIILLSSLYAFSLLKYTLYINTRTSLLENNVDAGNLQFALIFSKGPSLGRLGSLQGSFVDARLFAEIICVQTFMRFHIS